MTPYDGGMTTCNGCGGCCDPVTIGYNQLEARRMMSRGEITEEQGKWVTEVLVPMTPKEAGDIAPWLFTGRYRNAVDPTGDILTFYYRCTWFDRDARVCTRYDERPDVCRQYPWGYMGGPQERAALPPMCSFNVDVGTTPTEVPVKMMPKPVHR